MLYTRILRTTLDKIPYEKVIKKVRLQGVGTFYEAGLHVKLPRVNNKTVAIIAD